MYVYIYYVYIYIYTTCLYIYIYIHVILVCAIISAYSYRQTCCFVFFARANKRELKQRMMQHRSVFQGFDCGPAVLQERRPYAFHFVADLTTFAYQNVIPFDTLTHGNSPLCIGNSCKSTNCMGHFPWQTVAR